MIEAFFNYADFSEAIIEQTNFSFSIFYGAKFDNAEIDHTRFEYAAYHEAPLKKANIKSIVMLLKAEQIRQII